MVNKYVVVPIAAFALSATAASAFSPDILNKLDLNLSEEQISALEDARELRKEGEFTEAKEILEGVGLSSEDLQQIRESMREYRQEHRDAMREALESGDYGAYLAAVADTPMADVIDTVGEFDLLKQAHDLREAGDVEAAKEIFDQLGLPKPHGHGHGPGHHFSHDEDREEVQS